MIVVDTNVLAYVFLPSPYADDVDRLLLHDSEWLAPRLWRSEFCSVLSQYVRRSAITEAQALEMWQLAEQRMSGGEYQVSSEAVLSLSVKSGCSSYDCEYVVLAKAFSIPLITFDKKILASFPDVAFKIDSYLLSKND